MAQATTGTGLIELTEEQQAVVQTVREFVEDQVYPVAEELEHRDEYPEKIVEGMKELGLFGLTVPEEYGGGGVGPLTDAPFRGGRSPGGEVPPRVTEKPLT